MSSDKIFLSFTYLYTITKSIFRVEIYQGHLFLHYSVIYMYFYRYDTDETIIRNFTVYLTFIRYCIPSAVFYNGNDSNYRKYNIFTHYKVPIGFRFIGQLEGNREILVTTIF